VRYLVWRTEYYSPRDLKTLAQRLERYREYLTPIVRTPESWLFEITRWPEPAAPETGG
jgi:hypothetical protein